MALILIAVLFSLMLVTGQTLWKAAVADNPITKLSFADMLPIILSTYFITGFLIYGFSVIIYLYAISNFEFNKVQSLAIPLSLIFSLLSAWLVFNEDIKTTTVVGVLIILVGVYLVVVA